MPGVTETAEASDAALISRIRAGDTAAYGVLYERHLAAARGLARHLTDPEAAEDAVQETFAKVLDVLRRGGGPQAGFRPYLLTAVRRTVYDHYRGGRRVTATGEIELYDPGVPFVDPALEGLEQSMAGRAFRALPERWQAVLWHTEIEGQKPADVAPLLGLTANGVAALAYRAREGLRQAYLQMHLAATPRQECRPVLDKLGAYVRGGLGKRESKPVEKHLDECPDCKAIYAELADVNTTLRTAVGPLVLGTAAAAYLAAAKSGAAGGGVIGWFRHLPKRQQQAVGGGAATAAAAAVAVALTLVSADEPAEPVRNPPPGALAPSVPPPRNPQPQPEEPPPGLVPQPRPAPIAAPAESPGPTTPVPTPTSATSPAAAPAALTARIGAVGSLLRDQVGIVAMSVDNIGKGESRDVVADVLLPPGVTYSGGSTGRNAVLFSPVKDPGGGWSCRPRAARQGIEGNPVTCTRGPLGPGETASAYLQVDVSGSAPYDRKPEVTLRAGRLQASARASEGVAAGGLPARYATDGNVRAVQVGNTLLSCDENVHGCRDARARRGDRRDNDLWHMAPLDLDSDPGTERSSPARLELPAAKESVRWAGLYWSGVSAQGGETARLRAPGGSYEQVRAAEVARARLPIFPAYQAFADVTGLVRRYGTGEWWVADVPGEMGTSRYAGWSLVVVTEDPGAPPRQAMVLDGARVLGGQAPGTLEIALGGLLATAEPAAIGLVTWEGDADLAGDRVRLDGNMLTPAGGDGSAGNAFDSSATGPQLTFGVDVDAFSATLGPRPVLSLTTGRDALMSGVVVVTAPMRS